MGDDASQPVPSDEVVAEVYAQLRRVAGRLFASERAEATLQPTALVHEAFLALSHLDAQRWQSPAHYAATASRAMRRILIDRARRRGAAKHGGGWARVTLSGVGTDRSLADVVALDDALQRLEASNPRHARIVELRVFGGLTVAEIATVLGVSKRTVDGDWRRLRAWLAAQLDERL